MIISTINWHWPQWAYLAILFLRFLYNVGNSGKPMVQKDKTPMTYSGASAILNASLMLFILISGGFFK